MVKCLICDKEFNPILTRRRKYCSALCYGESCRRRTAMHYTRRISKVERNRRDRESYRLLMESVKQHFHNRCCGCGCNSLPILELTHMDGEVLGDSTRVVARQVIQHERHDILLLCPLCSIRVRLNRDGYLDLWEVKWGDQSPIPSFTPKVIVTTKNIPLTTSMLYGDKKYMSEAEEDTDI